MLIAIVALLGGIGIGFAIAIDQTGQVSSAQIRPTDDEWSAEPDAAAQRAAEDAIKTMRALTLVDGLKVGQFDIVAVRDSLRELTVLIGDPSKRIREVSVQAVTVDEVRAASLSMTGKCFALRYTGPPGDGGQQRYAAKHSGDCSPSTFGASDFSPVRWVPE